MTFVAWQHRLSAALLLLGSAATALTFAGCEVSPAKKPSATTDADDKQNDKAAADDASIVADKRATHDGTTQDGVAAETEVDPFEVPDGTVDELAKYINQLQQLRPEVTSKEELNAFNRKMGRAIVTAVDKILAQEPGESEVLEAVKFKLGVLEFLSKAGDEDALADQAKFLEQLHENASPALAQMLKERAMVKLLAEWKQLDEEQRATVLEKTKQYFAEAPADTDTLQFCTMIVRVLAAIDQTETAAEICSTLSDKFAQSSDPELADLAGKLKGLAYRVQLVGKEMEISGTLLDGAELDWASYRGKVVLVDFWATWCGPCLKELPNIHRNYLEYHDQGFEVIGISLDDNKKPVLGLVAERNIPWPILFSANEDQTGMHNPMAERFGILEIPVAILVDREGKVVSLDAHGEELGEELAKLFGKGAEGSAEQSKTEATKTEADAPQTDATGDDAKSDSQDPKPETKETEGAEK